MRTDLQAQFDSLTEQLHTRYGSPDDSLIECQLCFNQVLKWDIHEALIKRSGVPKDRQAPIFHIANCVPLCKTCHREYGQLASTRAKLFVRIARTVALSTIFNWYGSLLEEHGLSLKRAPSITIKSWKFSSAWSWAQEAARLWELELPDDGWLYTKTLKSGSEILVDYRAWVHVRWQGRRAKWSYGQMPESFNGIQRGTLEALYDDGIRLYQLLYVLGIELEEIREKTDD